MWPQTIVFSLKFFFERNKNTGGDQEQGVYLLLIYYQNAYNTWVWTMVNTSRSEPSYLPEFAMMGNWSQEQEPGSESEPFDVGTGHLTQHLNC